MDQAARALRFGDKEARQQRNGGAFSGSSEPEKL